MPTDGDEPLPKVTPSMLRDPERSCPLRLSLAHAGRTGNRGGDGRWTVRDRLTEAVRYAHADGGDPRPRLESPRTDGLCEEEVAILRRALGSYAELFPDPVEVLAGPPSERSFPELGVRLVGAPALAVRAVAASGGSRGERSGGGYGEGYGDDSGRVTGGVTAPVELRILRLGGPLPAPPPTVDPELLVALLLLGEPVPARIELTVSDLGSGRRASVATDGPEARREALGWLGGAVERLRSRTADPRPRVGLECGWCPYVAACPAHRDGADPRAGGAAPSAPARPTTAPA